MLNSIKNAYDNMSVDGHLSGDRYFHLSVQFNNIDRMTTSVDCKKYAKFLINDFKSMENKYGSEIYTKIHPLKLKALFSISEEYMWFSRKDLINFIDSECK